MKLVLDERLKHRLIGVVVLVAVAVIFLPAVMKKSNYRFDEHVSLSVRMPPKPPLPQVAVAGEKEIFQTVKVAHVDLPTAKAVPKPVRTVKAEPITTIPQPKKEPILAPAQHAKMPAPNKQMSKSVVAQKKIAPPSIAKKGKSTAGYAVQLASFTKQSNAKSLVVQLRKKGYKATYTKSISKQGELYKVIVGQHKQKTGAANLQKQLATKMQMNGFIVKTGVS